MEQEELLKVIQEQKEMMEALKQQMSAASVEKKQDEDIAELKKLKEQLVALQNANKPKTGFGYTEYGASKPEEYRQGDEIGYKRSFYVGATRSTEAKMSLQDISFVQDMK